MSNNHKIQISPEGHFINVCFWFVCIEYIFPNCLFLSQPHNPVFSPLETWTNHKEWTSQWGRTPPQTQLKAGVFFTRPTQEFLFTFSVLKSLNYLVFLRLFRLIKMVWKRQNILLRRYSTHTYTHRQLLWTLCYSLQHKSSLSNRHVSYLRSLSWIRHPQSPGLRRPPHCEKSRKGRQVWLHHNEKNICLIDFSLKQFHSFSLTGEPRGFLISFSWTEPSSGRGHVLVTVSLQPQALMTVQWLLLLAKLIIKVLVI